MELRQDPDQSSILIFGNMGLLRKGEGPIPAKSSWSPVSGDHLFGSRTARQPAAAAVGVAG